MVSYSNLITIGLLWDPIDLILPSDAACMYSAGDATRRYIIRVGRVVD